MKLNDAVWGALLILFSAAILVHVQGFPTIPGQKVGPALFPGLLAAGLAVCAVILIGKGIAARAAGHERANWAQLDGWTRSRRNVVALARSSASTSSTFWWSTRSASSSPASRTCSRCSSYSECG
jgi:putative tricarboxylic transport membrane protein